ncbi:putative bifunctional diguanylate cyclase/phosphodiesterase [Ectopseudomonas khazarica]|uniref:Bifunctional diguanylate cyclase/phosphodiesterase n=1 Tax=Ectopseudomonas khazarica TaxID=2502979 RepID=A0ABW7MJI6_9GAMM
MPQKALRENFVILVVDDQVSDAEVLREAVARLGKVHVANTSQRALDLARRFRPDVVLLDILMPDLDGLALCREMKADPKVCDAAIIFVTAHSQPRMQIRALESGGVDFVQKPIDVAIVRARVRAHLNLRRQANRLAYFDALSGLPNRILLVDRLNQAVLHAQRSGTSASLVLINLDDFKSINNHSGHMLGDRILHEVASRLEGLTDVHIDTIARPMGDEFAILLTNLEKTDSIGPLVENILNELSHPLYIEKTRFDLSACAGVSVYPEDSKNHYELFSHAEATMYEAKKLGRSRYRFFSEALEATARARLLLERHIRHALEQRIFEVFYQPMYSFSQGSFCRMEALIRWRQADGSLISPNEFIPVAENTGLIIPLGSHVLQRACLDALKLMRAGFTIPVSVNISAVQFREENFLEMVLGTLNESGLPAEMLELEITEGVLATDMAWTSKVLEELRANGIRVAIDDFGTGYSSLAYLKRLPIDVLKIDQGFVREMLSDKSDADIVHAIVRMGQALNLELVAEGVENEQQARKLMELGCDVLQGYLYARPSPFEELEELLQSQHVKLA